MGLPAAKPSTAIVREFRILIEATLKFDVTLVTPTFLLMESRGI